MNIKVDANTIKKIIDCGKNFSCLSDEMPIDSAELCIENILLNVSSMNGCNLHSNINQKRMDNIVQDFKG